MILKQILFKKFLLKTFNSTNNIVHSIFLLKQIIILYIMTYTQSVLNNQCLIINNWSECNTNLKLVNFITNTPYINYKKINNFISNWEILQQQLFLLKWIVCLIHLIHNKKISLPFNTIIKLFKKFIFLKKIYWTIFNLKNPTYFVVISKEFHYNIFKTYARLGRQTFFITCTPVATHYYCPTLSVPTLSCLQLIIELTTTAHIQGKYFFNKKLVN